MIGFKRFFLQAVTFLPAILVMSFSKWFSINVLFWRRVRDAWRDKNEGILDKLLWSEGFALMIVAQLLVAEAIFFMPIVGLALASVIFLTYFILACWKGVDRLLLSTFDQDIYFSGKWLRSLARLFINDHSKAYVLSRINCLDWSEKSTVSFIKYVKMIKALWPDFFSTQVLPGFFAQLFLKLDDNALLAVLKELLSSDSAVIAQRAFEDGDGNTISLHTLALRLGKSMEVQTFLATYATEKSLGIRSKRGINFLHELFGKRHVDQAAKLLDTLLPRMSVPLLCSTGDQKPLKSIRFSPQMYKRLADPSVKVRVIAPDVWAKATIDSLMFSAPSPLLLGVQQAMNNEAMEAVMTWVLKQYPQAALQVSINGHYSSASVLYYVACNVNGKDPQAFKWLARNLVQQVGFNACLNATIPKLYDPIDTVIATPKYEYPDNFPKECFLSVWGDIREDLSAEDQATLDESIRKVRQEKQAWFNNSIQKHGGLEVFLNTRLPTHKQRVQKSMLAMFEKNRKLLSSSDQNVLTAYKKALEQQKDKQSRPSAVRKPRR